MQEKSTTDLLHVLKSINNPLDMERYIHDYTKMSDIPAHFQACFKKHHTNSTEVLSTCFGFYDASYLKRIIQGKKNRPSKDVVLTLCLASHMTFKETRRTLELFGAGALYPRNIRDAIIAININQENFSIADINEQLDAAGEKILGNI